MDLHDRQLLAVLHIDMDLLRFSRGTNTPQLHMCETDFSIY